MTLSLNAGIDMSNAVSRIAIVGAIVVFCSFGAACATVGSSSVAAINAVNIFLVMVTFY
jgi:hypothetical protein